MTITKRNIRPTLDKTQPIYMGMDVHKSSWSICLIHCGQVLGRISMQAEFELLQKYLCRYQGIKIFSVYEAGFSGFHLHHQLTSIGISNTITPTNKMPILRADLVKTDRRDSLKLATFLAKGLLRSIHIPTEFEIDRRQILRTREQLKRKKTRAINQIKSLVIQHGIVLNGVGISQGTINYLSEVEMPPMIRMSVELHLDQIDLIKRQIKKLESEYKKISQEDGKYKENYLLLNTVPGIGPLVATALAYEIGDWSRFKNEKQISAFFGLTPSEFSSGGKSHRGRITGQGNPMLRSLIVQSSWKIVQKDPAMESFYLRVAHQTGSKKKAIVAVSRKLVCRIYAMIKNKKEYQSGIKEEAAA